MKVYTQKSHPEDFSCLVLSPDHDEVSGNDDKREALLKQMS